MSGMLSHIYFLLSGFKDADLSIMSQEFAHEASLISSHLVGFERLTVAPVVSFIHDWPKNACIRRAKPQGWYLRNRLIYARV
jgi:hypothetical protein